MKGVALATILVAGAITAMMTWTRHRHRLFGSLATAGSVVLLGVISVPPSSVYAASGSCQNPHCYSVLIANGSFSGAESQFHNEGLTMPNSEVQVGGHLNNELWLVTQNTSSVLAWVEEGLTIQCSVFPGSGQTCSQAGGVPEYQKFWADHYGSPTCVYGCYYFHSKGAVSADGTNNVYEIWNTSNGSNDTYNMYYNYNQIGTSTIQHVSSGIQVQSGLELYSPPGINSNESAGNFNNYAEGYQNGIGWAPFTTSNSYGTVDDGCGSGYPQGSCLNGISYHVSEWSDSKPS